MTLASTVLFIAFLMAPLPEPVFEPEPKRTPFSTKALLVILVATPLILLLRIAIPQQVGPILAEILQQLGWRAI